MSDGDNGLAITPWGKQQHDGVWYQLWKVRTGARVAGFMLLDMETSTEEALLVAVDGFHFAAPVHEEG
jgi:hypothetical protein